MGSAESHPSGSVLDDDGSVAAIVNDGSASKPLALLGDRHTVDGLSNPTVAANSSRQATDLIVAPATAAVCPGILSLSLGHYSEIVRIRMQSQYG